MSRGAAADAAAPFIVTLEFDEAGFRRLDALRRQHFPPERNLISAHLTLFHKLPGEAETEVARVLRAATRTRRCFTLPTTGLRFLGYGVALEMPSPELANLRGELAESWGEWLSPQDRHGFRPHVTIQNKASAAEARTLFEGLLATFEPFPVEATGLLLWRYLGGPWEAAGRFPFAPKVEENRPSDSGESTISP